MTTSRVVRGTKGRILIYICALLIITGIIACYNNTLSQLDDARKESEQCHQQQENLSTQLQVVFDYKQRLEKSLKTEKAEHQQTKNELESRVNEQKLNNEKDANEAKLRFSSLQQHYNLLQTQHDDFKEECSKIQRQQLDEINTLQSKLKEAQGQLKQLLNNRESALEDLKNQFMTLQVEKENLEKQIKGTQGSNAQSENEISHLTKVNKELMKELENLRAKYSIPTKKIDLESSKSKVSSTTFSKQVHLGDDGYQIRDSQNRPLDSGNMDNVEGEYGQNGQVDSPNQLNLNNNNENVLPLPDGSINNNVYKSSTKANPSSKYVSKGSLDGVPPLKSPTVTPESIKIKPSEEVRDIYADRHVLPLPYAQKQLPFGIVPIDNKPLNVLDEPHGAQKSELEDKIPDDVNDALPNRYRNNIIDNERANENKAIKAEKQEQIEDMKKKIAKKSLLNLDETDKENNAHEVVDIPVNNAIINGDGLFQSYEKEHGKAEDINKHVKLGEDEKPVEGHQPRLYEGQDGADYDKDGANDMQLDEPEDDDADDYGGHIERQKDPAVRN